MIAFMGLFESKPLLATVLGRAFRCLVCDHAWFRPREVKLNSTGAELFGLAWANASALGLVCDECGYVHEFAGRNRPQLWNEKQGYPEGAE
ncbi:hypothetical protein SAMN05421805_106216 [Saccharopolyspora antimicrobica]|uniref:Uncharacterized protein n=2 Tax=Saccharopolyspora antimicrobica TaxID=455193 RepID=A0A1I5BD44_9PSEU|nr:hypothetical protein ATL45_4941 [Saccharopolyspora antimicrobica]SFN72596.1 hypothetical protein SAMN05421805_106216 [Saccharopolyspora antimicrobica]